MSEDAKKAILARRARFMAAAVASVGLACGKESGAGGCGRAQPCLSQAYYVDGEAPQPCLSVPIMRPDADVIPMPDDAAAPDASTDAGAKKKPER